MNGFLFLTCFLFLLTAIIIYYDEISNAIQNWSTQKRIYKNSILTVERLAKIKLLSDNSKDIETFLEKNISSLLARLKELKVDKILNEDINSKFKELTNHSTLKVIK